VREFKVFSTVTLVAGAGFEPATNTL
jgi:hypothetical protein